MSNLSQTVNLYHNSEHNYKFQEKEAQYERDFCVPNRIKRLKDEYATLGMRRSVEGVLVVHEYNHPHVLLLQLGQSFHKLPGGELLPGESDEDGIRRLLTEALCSDDIPNVDWEVLGTLCSWWRPNFDNCLYPYVCSHITKPKEQKKVLLVQVPESYTFHIPRNCELKAVPLFVLYGNSQTYGPIISALPVILSQYNFIYHTPATQEEIAEQTKRKQVETYQYQLQQQERLQQEQGFDVGEGEGEGNGDGEGEGGDGNGDGDGDGDGDGVGLEQKNEENEEVSTDINKDQIVE